MPVTVQVLVEALRSWMVTQMVPAAPSLPWTDPRSAEGSQRLVAGPPLRGLVVEVGVSGPGPGCGLALGERPAAAGDWAVAAGSRSAMEWAVQPATATAATNTMTAMILAGRMATPPREARPGMGPEH